MYYGRAPQGAPATSTSTSPGPTKRGKPEESCAIHSEAALAVAQGGTRACARAFLHQKNLMIPCRISQTDCDDTHM